MSKEKTEEEKAKEIMGKIIEDFSFDKYEQLAEALKKIFDDPKVKVAVRRYMAGITE